MLAALLIGAQAHANEPLSDIELRLRPRVCTVAGNDDACTTTVRADWKAPRKESLCLIILEHPDVQRCWEQYAEGSHSVELTFATDLVVQLRDPNLERVLASEVVAVIREALQLRRKRRQPWSILF